MAADIDKGLGEPEIEIEIHISLGKDNGTS